MMAVTPELERLVIAARVGGQTYREIMAATGLNTETLHTLFARHGLTQEHVARGPDESRLTRWACPICTYRSDRAAGHLNCRGLRE